MREPLKRDSSEWLLILGLAAVGAGFLAISLSWLGAARYDAVPQQFPYLISGGGGGLALVLVGSALLVIRAIGLQQKETAHHLGELRDQLLAVRGEAAPAQRRSPRGNDSLVAVGAFSYHRPTCGLIRQRAEVELVPLEVALERELSPCRVCNPAREASAQPR